MQFKKNLTRAFATGLLALGGVLMAGGNSPLFADDTECVLGGPGVLCYTRSIQTCTEWKLSSWSVGTGVAMGITCSRLETIVQYYYKPTGSGARPTGKDLT